MKSLMPALKFRNVPPRASTRVLSGSLAHQPKGSLTALLRRAGPFEKTDGLPFTNAGLELTDGDAAMIRDRYRAAADVAGMAMVEAVRAALMSLEVPAKVLGVGPTINLPQLAIDYVVQRIAKPLRDAVIDGVVASVPGEFGRCGGMAFTALDLWEAGWPATHLEKPAPGDPLYRYIFDRLLDSLDANLGTFLERAATLQVLAVFSRTASGLLGASVGAIGGPIVAAVAGLVAGSEDVLGLGGPKAIQADNRAAADALEDRLRSNAAWPIGLVYGGATPPWEDHQILATQLERGPGGVITITVHDNNLVEDIRRLERLDLDLSGEELVVNAPLSRAAYADIKGFICEEYAPRRPITELHIVQ